MSKALILASASPRRAQILAQVGLKFKIITNRQTKILKRIRLKNWCVLWLKKRRVLSRRI